MDVLVVGGRNSAAEAALELYRHGVRVTMAVREPDLGQSVKYWLKPDLENRIREGAIRAFFDTTVIRIDPGAVVLCREGKTWVVKSDFVLALTGYRPDFEFLSACGVPARSDGSLPFDESTMETGVPGLYLAGVVAGGADIGRFFIENGRHHARQIVDHILMQDGRSRSEAPPPAAVGAFQEGD
jgi:thioredoxin reductase (NADPH)